MDLFLRAVGRKAVGQCWGLWDQEQCLRRAVMLWGSTRGHRGESCRTVFGTKRVLEVL